MSAPQNYSAFDTTFTNSKAQPSPSSSETDSVHSEYSVNNMLDISLSEDQENVLEYTVRMLDAWFPSYRLTIGPSIEYAKPGFQEITDFLTSSEGTTYESSKGSACSPHSASAQVREAELESQFLGNNFLESAIMETPVLNDVLESLACSPEQVTEQQTEQTAYTFPNFQKQETPARASFNQCIQPRISAILRQWGIDLESPVNADVHECIKQLLLNVNLTGTQSKKAAVMLMSNLYPQRRRFFPYSCGKYPQGSWPHGIPYKDPSHLNRYDRFVLLMWIYMNPEHSIETINRTHRTLKAKFRFEVSPEMLQRLYQFRGLICSKMSF